MTHIQEFKDTTNNNDTSFYNLLNSEQLKQINYFKNRIESLYPLTEVIERGNSLSFYIPYKGKRNKFRFKFNYKSVVFEFMEIQQGKLYLNIYKHDPLEQVEEAIKIIERRIPKDTNKAHHRQLFYEKILMFFNKHFIFEGYAYKNPLLLVIAYVFSESNVSGKFTNQLNGYHIEYNNVSINEVIMFVAFALADNFMTCISEYENIYNMKFIKNKNLFLNSMVNVVKSGVIDIDKCDGLAANINDYVPRNVLNKSIEMFSPLFEIM